MVASWRGDTELDGLARRVLARSATEARQAAEAEAAVALHLLERGCSLRVELPTPAGRSCDFEVVRGELRFFVHVKRLRGPGMVQLGAPASLRKLERVDRPFVVLVRWLRHAPGRLPRAILAEAERFLRGAQLGDEAVLHGADGAAVGHLRIIARSAEPHVMLALALADAPDGQRPRIQRLLRRAHEQFMPGGENVILVCADGASEHDLDTVLLGTPVERWDRLPPRGERVAHGRAEDGFWSGRHHERSRIVGRFDLADDGRLVPGRLWVRGDDEGSRTDAGAPRVRKQQKEQTAEIRALLA